MAVSTRTRIGRAASLTVALLAVTACQAAPTETPDPSGATPPSAAREPYATPEPTITTRPERPAEANEETAAGAIAFVEHYRQLYEYATATGNWKPLKQATSNECGPCAELWNPQGHLETRGGHPPLITYTDEDAVELSIQADNPFATAWIETPSGRWIPTNGDKPQKVGSEHWGVQFYLDWKDDTWTVRDLEIREDFEKRELDYIW